MFCHRVLADGHILEGSVICNGEIRQELGRLPEQMRGGSQTCRLIVLVKLREITGLLPLRFLQFFTDIVDCKHHLLFRLSWSYNYYSSLLPLDQWDQAL